MDKIGYTYDEILDFMTEGEGRSFLGRSMYDAIRETIEEKDKEIEILNKEKDDLDDCNRHLYNENKRLNNIINELEKWLKDYINLLDKPDVYEEQTLEDLKEVLDKLKELKEGK